MPGTTVMMTELTALRDGCYYQCDTEKAGVESSSQGPAEGEFWILNIPILLDF